MTTRDHSPIKRVFILISGFLGAFSLAAALSICLTAPVYAQTDQEQAATEAPKVTEEMVVTARKQEETLQEVPISVAAPSESQLRDRGAETIEDVAANVAGFTVQPAGPGQSQVGMRGVSAGRIIRDQPGVKEQVGVYLDESVISLSLFTPDIDLFDLSRVEVLRGPQGTLFGSGSLAGTVRYITNQPKLSVTESIAELNLNTITDGGVGGSVKYAGNLPIGDKAATRIVAYYTRYGGFTDAVQPDLRVEEDVNSGHRAGARVAFRFDPSDRLRITPRVVYQDVDLDGWSRIDVFNILGNPFTTSRPSVELGNRRIVTQLDEPFTDEFLLGDLNIEYDFGGKRLTSITSYTDRDILVIRDAGALTSSITGGSFGAPASVFTLDAPLFDATGLKALTQEVRLSGDVPRLQWVAGAFYGTNERDYGQNLPVIGFEDQCKVVNCGGLSNVPTAGTKLAFKDELFKSDLHYEYDQLAIFGEATYSVTDRLDLTGGLRYYDYQEDRTQVFDGIFADPIDSVGSSEATGVAPRFILSYDISDATRLNAQISKGFRLGGINDPLNLPLCQPQDLALYGGRDSWEDEILWNYEVGAKTVLGGGRGTFAAAAYYNDIEDLQATVTAGTCSSRIIFNVPEARTVGVEAEFELAPSDNFDFAISGNYNNSEIRSTVTAPGPGGVPIVVAGIREGARLPSVPEFQMAAAATYRFQVNAGLLAYTTGVFQHVGERLTNIGDDENFGSVDITGFTGDIGGPFTQNTFTFDPVLPSYDILNLRLGFLKGNYDVAFFINNVTDEEAFLTLDVERGSRARVSYLTNQPRTFGVSTRFNF